MTRFSNSMLFVAFFSKSILLRKTGESSIKKVDCQCFMVSIPFIAALAVEAPGYGHPAALSATHLQTRDPQISTKHKLVVSFMLDFQIIPTMCDCHMISHNWGELAGNFKGQYTKKFEGVRCALCCICLAMATGPSEEDLEYLWRPKRTYD